MSYEYLEFSKPGNLCVTVRSLHVAEEFIRTLFKT